MDFVDVVAAGQAYRGELLAFCYRMLGSVHDAEDLVQETMLRAWRAGASFDPAKASLRTWLYRIATNACLTALRDRNRRWLPNGLPNANWAPDVAKLERREDIPWLGPIPDALLDPAAVVESRDTIRLAFIAALQYLPARQRAALILRDVLVMPAAEVAVLLETSVASVNSALQRARASLAAASPVPDGLAEPSESDQRELLDRYLAAFEAMDTDALKRTLREDALLQMPPFPEWFRGRETVGAFFATVYARGGSFRFAPARANGQPAIGVYLRRNSDTHRYHHIAVLTMARDGIARVDAFQDPRLPGVFGLPAEL
jgi:RNA polymerase sigma-70 factor, ECF subfamily